MVNEMPNFTGDEGDAAEPEAVGACWRVRSRPAAGGSRNSSASCVDDFRDVILFEDLAVGRDVALVDAVQISELDFEGGSCAGHSGVSPLPFRPALRALQVLGDFVDDVFDGRHALRAAEAAEGGVRRDSS